MNAVSGRTNSKRIAWVDILRFLGMTLIYWGHMGPSDNVVLFIFAHHVPLFFFISGFFAGNRNESSFFAFLWKKIRQIVLPYLVFTILYYALQLANGSLSVSALPAALLASAKGVRNEAPGPLWFFTCLFIVCVAYEVIRRFSNLLLKQDKAGKALSMGICVALYLIGILCLGHEPTQDPVWIWNVDSAFVYLLYFGLGALLFPLIRNWKFAKKKTAARAGFFVCFVLSVLFGLFMILSGARFTAGVSEALHSALASSVLSDALFEIYGLLCAVILIFMELSIARLISLIPGVGRFLAFVGKDSLYHCGNELLIKYFGGLLISAVGLQSIFLNDLGCLLYSMLCLIVLTFTLNLLERFLFGRLFRNGTLSF